MIFSFTYYGNKLLNKLKERQSKLLNPKVWFMSAAIFGFHKRQGYWSVWYPGTEIGSRIFDQNIIDSSGILRARHGDIKRSPLELFIHRFKHILCTFCIIMAFIILYQNNLKRKSAYLTKRVHKYLSLWCYLAFPTHIFILRVVPEPINFIILYAPIFIILGIKFINLARLDTRVVKMYDSLSNQ